MNKESTGLILLFKRVLNKLGRPYGVNPFPRAFENHMAAGGRETIFDGIYKQNFWSSPHSRSGVGSELEFTNHYRAALSSLIKEMQFSSVFDAPCGDLNWMQDIINQDQLEHYIGGDISKSLVFDLNKKFPNIDVRHFDICEDKFPSADVWHCRDCLFHLPFVDIKAAFENFISSNVPYVLFTTHRARFMHKNLDVPAGGFRFLDLEHAPFSLPPAERYLADFRRGVDFPRYVGLWKREAIAEALSNWPTQASSL